mmetsp:Transcript_5379/g.13526  ORF Transcript_5379/g.13526 Transcript_5379/m.13526 type:complete len:556 (+) Transcript_5379:534-2201(+)
MSHDLLGTVGPETCARIGVEQSTDQIGTHLVHVLLGHLEIVFEDCRKHLSGGFTIERRGSSQELEKHHTNCPPICLMSMPETEQHLRSQIFGRSGTAVGLGGSIHRCICHRTLGQRPTLTFATHQPTVFAAHQRGGGRRAQQAVLLDQAQLGEAKVDELEVAIGGDEQIVRLEVSMHHADAVQVAHGQHHLGQVVARHVERERIERLAQREEIPARAVLHQHQQAGGRLAGVEETRHKVRVRHGQHLPLGPHPIRPLCRLALRHHLHGVQIPGGLLAHQQHLSVAAARDPLDQLKVREPWHAQRRWAVRLLRRQRRQEGSRRGERRRGGERRGVRAGSFALAAGQLLLGARTGTDWHAATNRSSTTALALHSGARREEALCSVDQVAGGLARAQRHPVALAAAVRRSEGAGRVVARTLPQSAEHGRGGGLLLQLARHPPQQRLDAHTGVLQRGECRCQLGQTLLESAQMGETRGGTGLGARALQSLEQLVCGVVLLEHHLLGHLGLGVPQASAGLVQGQLAGGPLRTLARVLLKGGTGHETIADPAHNRCAGQAR